MIHAKKFFNYRKTKGEIYSYLNDQISVLMGFLWNLQRIKNHIIIIFFVKENLLLHNVISFYIQYFTIFNGWNQSIIFLSEPFTAVYFAMNILSSHVALY